MVKTSPLTYNKIIINKLYILENKCIQYHKLSAQTLFSFTKHLLLFRVFLIEFRVFCSF